MVEIGWIELPENVKKMSFEMSGGETYEKHLFDILSEEYNVDGGGIVGSILHRNIIKNFYKSLKLNEKKDIWIKELNSAILPINKIIGKNILLFHHIDGGLPTSCYLLNMILKKNFYRNLNKIDTIVTVSRYWKEHFRSKGYNNTKVIYNAFDINQFKFKWLE